MPHWHAGGSVLEYHKTLIERRLDAIFCIESWNIGAASIGDQGGCANVRHAQSTRAEEHNWRNLHNKRKSPEVGLETYPWRGRAWMVSTSIQKY